MDNNSRQARYKKLRVATAGQQIQEMDSAASGMSGMHHDNERHSQYDNKEIHGPPTSARLESQHVRMEHVVEIARMAACAVLKYYEDDDVTPLTMDSSDGIEERLRLAKVNALNVIIKGIRAFYPNIPIIYERGLLEVAEDIAPTVSKQEQCFCVNPLDGEIDFMRRQSSGFALSIGFCIRGEPILGVICCPAAASPPPVYFAASGAGAFAEKVPQTAVPIHVADVPTSSPKLISHHFPKNSEKESNLSVDGQVLRVRPPAAMCLRFLSIADGSSHIFPFYSPSSEWDTCAGHAILLAAGGTVTTVDEQGISLGVASSTITYGKSTPLNTPFVASGKAAERRIVRTREQTEKREGTTKDEPSQGNPTVEAFENRDTNLPNVIATDDFSNYNWLNVALITIIPIAASVIFAYYYM
jgi:3'(2'), 5'-bisphosphate nucleotidase